MRGDAEALLFDLGQVVIEVDFERAFARWAHYGAISADVIGERYSQDEYYRLHEIGDISSVEYFDSLRASLSVDISDAQFLEGWNAVFVGEMANISKVLRQAAKVMPLYAFSNSNPAHEQFWPNMFEDTLSHFRKVFVSSAIGMRKPAPDAFEHVAGQMGVPAERIVFFDDLAENVEGARAVGMRAVHVTTPQCVANALCKEGVISL